MKSPTQARRQPITRLRVAATSFTTPVILRRAARYLRPPVVITAGLLVLTASIFHRQLFDGWTFPWDFLGTYSTTPAFVAATFGHGHPLSWSPFVASGFPVDVDPQAGLYFPGWWLLGALRIPATLSVLTAVQVAHVFFGAIGMLLLARARRLAWPWAALSALAYVFFGGYYGQAEHADIFRGFSYLPWLLWALTPPVEAGKRWTRLMAVPLVAWLIASGAYPGQIVSFAIAGSIYVTTILLTEGRSAWRTHRTALLLAAIASVAVCLVVLTPYIRAEQAGELFRENEPTAASRAGFAIAPLDLFGLYLNNFAWTAEGTITTWVIGIPTLIGLGLVRTRTLRSQIPLIACGLAALVLAMTPKIGFLGRAMASLRPIFPSRFPASEYKAVVAIALILLSADAWSRISVGYDSPRLSSTKAWSHISAGYNGRRWTGAALLGAVLVGGALLVPHTYAQPTRSLWLVLVVIVATVALAIACPPARVLACLLMVLVVIDGAREISDYRLAGIASPWQALAPDPSFYETRDEFVRELPQRLQLTVASRPAREPAISPPEPEAAGWVANAYQESDYDPTIERSLWEAQHNPAWLALLLAPWHGYTFPCSTVGCVDGDVHLPQTTIWTPSSYVHTTSFGTKGVTYAVDISHPMLLVENELAVRGWHANIKQVRPVDANLPFRAWRLSPGHYDFTATFQEPGRSLQYLALAVALVGWLGCVVMLIAGPGVSSRRLRAKTS
jgi:hypothetical protein